MVAIYRPTAQPDFYVAFMVSLCYGHQTINKKAHSHMHFTAVLLIIMGYNLMLQAFLYGIVGKSYQDSLSWRECFVLYFLAFIGGAFFHTLGIRI